VDSDRLAVVRLAARAASGCRPAGGPWVVEVSYDAPWKTSVEYRLGLRLESQAEGGQVYAEQVSCEEWRAALVAAIG
jgi:hypothetical protein